VVPESEGDAMVGDEKECPVEGMMTHVASNVTRLSPGPRTQYRKESSCIFNKRLVVVFFMYNFNS